MKSKAHQLWGISHTTEQLINLCRTQCDAEFLCLEKQYAVWIFGDGSTIRIDRGETVTIDGALK